MKVVQLKQIDILCGLIKIFTFYLKAKKMYKSLLAYLDILLKSTSTISF